MQNANPQAPEKIRMTKAGAVIFAELKAIYGMDYSVIAERLAKQAKKKPKLLLDRP